MQGNGGTMSVDLAARHAVNTLMSGPAAGVKAAAYTALAAGHRNIITCDMGGTSFDVGVIRDGRPALTADKEMGYGLPVRVPMIDIHTIGAGGGSIARVNSAGILQVGPESAGADPGSDLLRARRRGAHHHRRQPAARASQSGRAARGGSEPPQLDRIREIFDKKIGAHLGLGPDEVASAIVRVANDKMAGAIRLVSLQRGHDPRDFVLFAFGGAGPLHAVALARELAIPRVLVPARPGITSALGCLVADVRHDFVKTVNQGVLRLDLAGAHRILAAQVDEGRRMLASEGVEVETVSVQHEADMQFVGQTHVLTVPVARTDFAREDLMRAFEAAYWERFEVELREMRAQVVSLRTAVIGRRRPVSLQGLIALEPAPAGGAVPADRRRAWFDGQMARHAGVPAGAARRRRGAHRPGHRRAARLHHRDRAGGPGARGRARQPRDHRPDWHELAGSPHPALSPKGRGREADGWMRFDPDGDLEVAERVDAHPVARLDHRGRVELLHDGRAPRTPRRRRAAPADRPACRATARRTRRAGGPPARPRRRAPARAR